MRAPSQFTGQTYHPARQPSSTQMAAVRVALPPAFRMLYRALAAVVCGTRGRHAPTRIFVGAAAANGVDKRR